jgi:hypothetical protein
MIGPAIPEKLFGQKMCGRRRIIITKKQTKSNMSLDLQPGDIIEN